MNAKGNDRLNSLVSMLKEKFRHFLAVNISIDKLVEVRGFQNVRLGVEVKESRWQW